MSHQTACFNENKGKPNVVASHLCHPQQQVIPLKPECADGPLNSTTAQFSCDLHTKA